MSNQLKTAWAGRRCLCFETLESTNDYGKELAAKENVHGTLIIAQAQTSGRGRRGRSWQSKPGENIMMSLCVEPEFAPEYAAGLTLVMALAAAEAVSEVTEATPRIKWPNDLVLNGRKICGILTELHLKKEGYAVIIGVGINVEQEKFPEEISSTAGSLKLETGKNVAKTALINAVMKHFEEYYEQYEQTKDLSLMKTKYESLLANQGKEVKVLDPLGAYTGIAEGINPSGNLIVVCEDGSRKEVDSGEVSVRGLYGYL